jgi:hypothetical protein
MALPALDVLRESNETSPVVDARAEAVPGIVEIVLAERLLQE